MIENLSCYEALNAYFWFSTKFYGPRCLSSNGAGVGEGPVTKLCVLKTEYWTVIVS